MIPAPSRLAIALALCALVAPEVSAQTAGGTAPARPVPARQAAAPTTTAVDVMTDAFGGYDTAVEGPTLGLDGTGTGDTSQRTLGGNLSLSVERLAGRSGFRASGQASARSFPAVSDSVVTSYGGTLSGQLALGRRASLSASQNLGYAPVSLLSLFTTTTGSGPFTPGLGLALDSGAVDVPAADYALSAEKQLSSNSDLTLSYALSRSLQLRASGGYSVAEFLPLPGAEDSGNSWLKRWRASGGLDQRLGRYATLYAGYMYSADASTVGAGANVLTAGTIQGFDGGVRYGRPLGFSRRTRVYGALGSGALGAPGAALQYTLLGNAGINHEIGRTWVLALDAQRDLRFVTAYTAPVTSNTAVLSVRGGLATRTTLTLSGLYTQGSVGGITVNARDLASRSASLQVRHGLTNEVGVFAEYFYFRSAFAVTASPVGTAGLTALGRQGARVGVSVGRLLAGRRRN